jgi:beta-glucosidase/6-phospho-beta-glucosidase/beta-galactosidase
MDNQKYNLFHSYSGMIIDEFKDEVKDTKNLNKLMSLQQEIFFRVIRPQRAAQEVREDIKQDIDKKIDEVANVVNLYMDYKEQKISKDKFLNQLEPGKALNEIKDEMKNKSQAQELHQEQKNITKRNK